MNNYTYTQFKKMEKIKKFRLFTKFIFEKIWIDFYENHLNLLIVLILYELYVRVDFVRVDFDFVRVVLYDFVRVDFVRVLVCFFIEKGRINRNVKE